MTDHTLTVTAMALVALVIAVAYGVLAMAGPAVLDIVGRVTP